MASIAPGKRQRLEQPGNTLIESAFPISASLVAEDASYPALPDPGRPRDQKPFGPIDPVAGGQLLEQRAIDAATIRPSLSSKDNAAMSEDRR